MRTRGTVQAPWQAVLQRLLRALREQGFDVRRTFDLQLARQSLRRSEVEPCPHHGTALCSCQYLVLQVSGSSRPPSALVIHGHDRTTTISLLTGATEAAQRMGTTVWEALEHPRTASAVSRSGEHAVVDPGQRGRREHP